MGLTDMLDVNTKVIKKPILKNIEIEDIVTNELNIETIKEIEELKSSILQFGLMKPLEVYESEKGIYKLLGGERRYTALSSLIKEEKYDSEIPCLIYQHQGEVVERLMMLASNADRTKNKATYVRKTKEALAILELQPELKPKGMLKRVWVGNIIGCSGRTVQNYMDIIDGKEKKTAKEDPYKSEREDLALHIQRKLGTKVKCTKNKVEIYYRDVSDLNRLLSIMDMENIVNE